MTFVLESLTDVKKYFSLNKLVSSMSGLDTKFGIDTILLFHLDLQTMGVFLWVIVTTKNVHW